MRQKNYIELSNNPKGYTHLLLEKFYSKGGYIGLKRGIYLMVVPVTRTKDDICTMETFEAYTGIRSLVIELSKLSEKQFTNVDSLQAGQTIVEAVLKNHELTKLEGAMWETMLITKTK